MAKSKKLKEKEANSRQARLLRDHNEYAAKVKALYGEAHEKALERARWREEANKELKRLIDDKAKELAARPWYKKLLGI